MNSVSQGMYYANEVMDERRGNPGKPTWFILEKDHTQWTPLCALTHPFLSLTYKGKDHLNSPTICIYS